MNPDPKENKAEFLEILRLKKEKAAEDAAAIRFKAKEEALRQREAAQQEALAKKETLLREKEEARQREQEAKQKQADEERERREEIAAARLREVEERQENAIKAKEETLKQREAAQQAFLAKKETLLREREEARQQAIVKTEAQLREREEARQREQELKQKQADAERQRREEIAAARLREVEERQENAIKAKEETLKQREAAQQAVLAKKETLLREKEESRQQAIVKTEAHLRERAEVRQQAIVKKEAIKQNKSAKRTTLSRKKFGGQVTVAVDIGSRYVKLAVSDGNGKIKIIEVARRPAAPNEITVLLSEWVIKHHLERKPTFSSVSGPEINVQYLPLPALSGKELAGAIRIEAEQILGEDLSQMDSDFSLLGQKNEKRNVLFIAAPQILGDERFDLLKSAGLKPAGLTTDGIALANGYLANTGNGSEATLLLNIGHQISNLAVVEKNELLFVRDILWGNEKMVQEIVSTTNFDALTVLDILEKGQYAMITLPEIINKVAVSLLEELEKTISYCRQTLEINVRKMVVTGGGSQIPSLPDFLAERMLLEIEPYPILKDLDLRMEQKERLAPFCAVLTGLSLETEASIATRQI